MQLGLFKVYKDAAILSLVLPYIFFTTKVFPELRPCWTKVNSLTPKTIKSEKCNLIKCIKIKK